MTSTQFYGPDQVDAAAHVLRDGRLLAFPTETVYGLGADARNGAAVARIYEAKGRPSFNPLIVHVSDLKAAQAIGEFDENALRLAQAFWPGPLSLVVPLRRDARLSSLVTAGLDTVAIRVPAGALAKQLLSLAGCPIAAPSANKSGQISPTTAAHVSDGLNGRIDGILDGGPCQVGLESTIMRATPPTLLRPGGVSLEAIAAVFEDPILSDLDPDMPNAPGQLSSHYAPDAAVQLNATEAPLLLGFADVVGDLSLSPTGDLIEAAANLFSMLRQMDARAKDAGLASFAVAPIPNTGLGLAINDRVKRAAAPRSGGSSTGG